MLQQMAITWIAAMSSGKDIDYDLLEVEMIIIISDSTSISELTNFISLLIIWDYPMRAIQAATERLFELGDRTVQLLQWSGSLFAAFPSVFNSKYQEVKDRIFSEISQLGLQLQPDAVLKEFGDDIWNDINQLRNT